MKSRIPEILKKNEASILSDWIKAQAETTRSDLLKEGELREQSGRFVQLFREAMQGEDTTDILAPNWAELRDHLNSISRTRIQQGFSAAETAVFVYSFKQVLFSRLQKEYTKNTDMLIEEVWSVTKLIDKLGLFTTDAFQKGREEIITRQQHELLELSTPVVILWDGILALPLIGVLDSARTQVVMESLLQKIVETGSSFAIIDITGVPTVDTLVAQHLIKTVTAARLMGADCIISGIRPQIAQTIVHLGVELGDVTTKSNLKDAFAIALKRSGMAVASVKSPNADKA